MSKRAKSAPAPFRYEDAVQQIESIIERIESGQAGLDETLRECEVGLKLIQQCREVLDAAQKRLSMLTADDQGALREVEGQSTESRDGDDEDSTIEPDYEP